MYQIQKKQMEDIMSIVRTVNLNKKYKHKHALKDFNISIKQGDIYGLIGVNGAGKSTLIKIIAGITEPTSGTLYLFDNMNDLHLSRRKIGAVIENPAFSPNLSARQNLEYYATVKGMDDKNVIIDILNKVKLDPNSKQPFKQFSLGMKQRLGIAFALLNNPEFIILDEPTNGLDPIGILELRDIIFELNKNGVTFLICSHILAELSQIATKYGIVHNGQFIAELTNDDLVSYQNERIDVVLEPNNGKKFMDMLMEKKIMYTINGKVFSINLKDKNLNDFIRYLSEYDIQIKSINQKQDTLEEVFLKMIGGKNNV
jgi:ABC-type multidrug transport system ATPase subunit